MACAGQLLALACLGLYGTVSNAARRRTAELGLRVALGADRGAVQRPVVREALLLVVLGGTVGLPVAALAARALRGLLYGVTPLDPVAYGMAVGLPLVVCVCAAYIPAYRASRLDPVVALRGE